MPWLLISGGRDQYIVFCLFLHIHLHGHGSNGVGERNSNDYVNLSVQSMIMHAYGLAVHVLCMKGLR